MFACAFVLCKYIFVGDDHPKQSSSACVWIQGWHSLWFSGWMEWVWPQWVWCSLNFFNQLLFQVKWPNIAGGFCFDLGLCFTTELKLSYLPNSPFHLFFVDVWKHINKFQISILALKVTPLFPDRCLEILQRPSPTTIWES